MTLTINLAEEETTQLNAKAVAEGLSAEQCARQLLKQALALPTAVPPRRHISETIRERMRKVPSEMMATMPADGASQHDHYIHGLPKREE